MVGVGESAASLQSIARCVRQPVAGRYSGGRSAVGGGQPTRNNLFGILCDYSRQKIGCSAKRFCLCFYF